MYIHAPLFVLVWVSYVPFTYVDHHEAQAKHFLKDTPNDSVARTSIPTHI